MLLGKLDEVGRGRNSGSAGDSFWGLVCVCGWGLQVTGFRV